MLKWADEFGRARYYAKQMEALIAGAGELNIPEIKKHAERLCIALDTGTIPPHEGHIPSDARTCLHQASLALINIKGSLVADGKRALANSCETLRGEIIDWFDFEDDKDADRK